MKIKKKKKKKKEIIPTENECWQIYRESAVDNIAYWHLLFNYGYYHTEAQILQLLKHDWNISIPWKSIYGLVNEPIYTHKKDVFEGTLDYLFVNDGFRVISYLEMPWQRNFQYHVLSLQPLFGRGINNNNNDNNGSDDVDLLKKKEKELEQLQELKLSQDFNPVPNELYSSDHLALVADIEFMPTIEEATQVLQHLKFESQRKLDIFS